MQRRSPISAQYPAMNNPRRRLMRDCILPRSAIWRNSCRRVLHVGSEEGRKQFFFEKKNQKFTFYFGVAIEIGGQAQEQDRVADGAIYGIRPNDAATTAAQAEQKIPLSRVHAPV